MKWISKMENIEYYVSKTLKRIWERCSLLKLKDMNNDRVYIVDGRERTGKSTFAIQQMIYLEPGLLQNKEEFVKRICFTPEEFNKTVRETKNGVIIFDEAFRGLSSKSALSKVNKMIVTTLMEMGQNNNIVFLVLPSIHKLEPYAVQRSYGQFRVYNDPRNFKKRCFAAFGERKMNSIKNAGVEKEYKFIKYPNFRGRFFHKFPGGEEFEKIYLEKKQQALRGIEEEIKLGVKTGPKPDWPWDFMTKILIWHENKILKVPLNQIKEKLFDLWEEKENLKLISRSELSRIMAEMGKLAEKHGIVRLPTQL